MAEKDITEKNLEALNDVFADIVNVLLFKGERLVQEDELEADTTKSMFKADGKIHEQSATCQNSGRMAKFASQFSESKIRPYRMPICRSV